MKPSSQGRTEGKRRQRNDAKPKALPSAKKGHAKTKAGKRGAVHRSTAHVPLLADLMKSPVTAPPLPQGQALLEAGVLAFRRKKNGEPRILLISKKRARQWGIPKGKLLPHLSFAENAAREAWEEAGVLGTVSPNSIAMFRARKRSPNPQIHLIIEVWVYLLEVSETLAKWPEKGKREIRWVTCEMAARQLREPVLAHLCHRLAQA